MCNLCGDNGWDFSTKINCDPGVGKESILSTIALVNASVDYMNLFDFVVDQSAFDDDQDVRLHGSNVDELDGFLRVYIGDIETGVM